MGAMHRGRIGWEVRTDPGRLLCYQCAYEEDEDLD